MAVEYSQTTESEITNAIESVLQQEIGNNIDLTEGSTFSTLAEMMGAVLANNQEEDLEEVYKSGFLSSATGTDLEEVVAIIGLQRRSAIHATGTQRFISNQPVTTDTTIQKGTVIQTDSSDPIEFETTEPANLEFVDGFESGNLNNYAGDTGTGTFSIVSSHPHDGSNELQAGAVSGDHIYNDTVTIGEGTSYHAHVYAEANTVPIVTFGVQDSSNYYQFAVDCSAADGSEELRIEKVEGGTVSQTIATTTGLNIPEATYMEVELDWNLTGNIGITLHNGDTEVATVGGTDADTDRWREGYVGFKSGDATAAKYFDTAGASAVSANIRALVGGGHANIGAESLTILPSPPTGVDETSNTYPTGNSSYEDTNAESYTTGNDEETDDELRERATDSVSQGGDATHDAVVSHLLAEVDGITSITVYENKTDTDNTGTGGLPPYSFETVVYGGSDTDVARALFEKKALTSRDYGGAHGTAVSKSVTAESNGQSFTIDFSRPTAVNIDFTMDVVIDDTYIGDNALKDRIVEYIGGTLGDGSDYNGLENGQDVYIDEVEDIVTGKDDTGVVGFDMNASAGEITTTPAKTTNSNGLQIISIGENEVAQTDATDGSITINKTQQ